MRTLARARPGALGVIATIFVLGCAVEQDTADAARLAARLARRNPRWAKPMARQGLPNLHRVSNDLYRGAQPTSEGIRDLKKMGVKTIVNLRVFHSDSDEIRDAGIHDDGTGEGGIGYVHISFKAWHAEDEDIVPFLRVVTDPARTPVFVHCQHGADRTGTMCAVYRIVVQGWSREDAIEEMRRGGFKFHKIWVGLPKYLRRVDVEKLRREAGMD